MNKAIAIYQTNQNNESAAKLITYVKDGDTYTQVKPIRVKV